MGLPNLEIANVNEQSVDANGYINFGLITRKQNQNGLPTPTFEVNNNASSITLTQAGYYQVNVNAVFNADTAGDVELALYMNGVPVPQAYSIQTISTATTEIRSASFSALIRVFGGCLQTTPVTLALVNSGIAANYKLTNIDIVKISK